MLGPITRSALVCLLAVSTAHAATFEHAEQLYIGGDLDGARTELDELLEGATAEGARAPALELLGRIAIDRREWHAALEAWGELSDEHALTPQAAAVSAAIRPLQALVECACSDGDSQLAASTPAPAGTAPPPVVATRPPVPAAPAADGTLLVGGWGAEYEASLEVTDKLIEFLDANDVKVRAASTEVPAIHGEDVVLSYLLEEAREVGASGVLFLTSRFNFREFIEIRRFDVNGTRIWREKLVGGTALKERHDRDRPSWGLFDRATKELSKRLGTPDLPTGE